LVKSTRQSARVIHLCEDKIEKPKGGVTCKALHFEHFDCILIEL